jgi:hypothetical protein
MLLWVFKSQKGGICFKEVSQKEDLCPNIQEVHRSNVAVAVQPVRGATCWRRHVSAIRGCGMVYGLERRLVETNVWCVGGGG